MPEYTANHSIAYPLPGDRVKDSNVAAKLAADIQATALTADAAITTEGTRAENAAKQDAATALSQARQQLNTAITTEGTRAENAAIVTSKADLLKRMPEMDDAGVLAVIADADGRHTFMAARDSDGAPTEHAARLIAQSQNDHELIGGDYLWALTDATGRATDLTVRASDGQFPDWIIDRIANRLAERGGTTQLKSDKWVHPSGDVVPVHVDMSEWSAWGSSGIDLMRPQLQNVGDRIGAPYHNGAKGGERFWHTEARLGSHPAQLEFPNNSIPGSTDPVAVMAENVPPLSAMRPFTGTINGVHGTLRSTDETLTFTRTTAGDPTDVEPGARFIPEIGVTYRDKPAVIQLGKNNINLEPDSGPGVIESHHRAFDWFAPLTKRIIVIGHHANRDWGPTSTVLWNRLAEVNNALRDRYGDQFFDLQAWMSSPEVWDDTGLIPTQEDLDAQVQGSLPPSLSRDHLHFNEAMNAAFAQKIQDMFHELEWY